MRVANRGFKNTVLKCSKIFPAFLYIIRDHNLKPILSILAFNVLFYKSNAKWMYKNSSDYFCFDLDTTL